MFIKIIFEIYLIAIFIVFGEGIGVANSNRDLINFNKPFKSEILKAINDARSEPRDCHDGLGLRDAVKPLSWNSKLYYSAYEHSSDLAESNTFDHLGSGTKYDITASSSGKRSLFYERIEANGYVGYHIVGENIAGGQSSLEEVMEALLNSPEHCANIMNPNYKEVGVAIVVNPNSDYGIYWTQNFGGKK